MAWYSSLNNATPRLLQPDSYNCEIAYVGVHEKIDQPRNRTTSSAQDVEKLDSWSRM